jgi:RsiW-degrading membrane proteinase PrsW (M82 family)
MEKYNDLFKWMIIPMVIMQLGIFGDYWWDFSENAWAVHVHYWTGTAWYLYLIIQPYFISRGQFERHRTNGIIGMFLAGGVCLTALSMMNRDIVTTQKAIASPEAFGPFQPWFFFGVAAVEIVMMTAFGIAVIMSILRRHSVEDHAWWLISSVFLIMMPALGRGIQNVYVGLNFSKWPDIDIMPPLYLTQLIILGMLLAAGWKYDKLRHPATYLAAGVNIFVLLLEPLGRSQSIQSFLTTFVKG